MTSFGLIEELHRLVKPEYWIEAEEWVCNLLADYAEVVVVPDIRSQDMKR